MIEVKNLTAGYGGREILKGVSAQFLPGKVTVLVGPNGSGKSTLLKAALGLLPSGVGQVLYDGTPIEKLSRREVARKAALLAQSRTSASIEAERLVLHGRFPYLSYPRHYSAEDKRIAAEAMERSGASPYAHRIVDSLSGGQKQSVYLAMLLTQQTQTVFLDEPTTFLDIRHQLDMMDWMKQLAREGHAVVLILHDLPMAMETADRILVMQDGKICREGTPDEIYDSGVLETVFGIRFCRLAGEDGLRYYCDRKKNGGA